MIEDDKTEHFGRGKRGCHRVARLGRFVPRLAKTGNKMTSWGEEKNSGNLGTNREFSCPQKFYLIKLFIILVLIFTHFQSGLKCIKKSLKRVKIFGMGNLHP